MRISELSAASGVPLPTLKFYLREGLLPAGEATAPNQAEYGDVHLRRLRLIRALTEIGGLRLRDVGRVLAAIDEEQVPLHDVLGVAQYALGPEEGTGSTSPADEEIVDRALAAVGWQVSHASPARRSLARTVAALRGLGWDVPVDVLVRYARAVDELAAREVAAVGAEASRSETVERMVVGTVMFESILTALRRLANEHHSSRQFGKERPVG